MFGSEFGTEQNRKKKKTAQNKISKKNETKTTKRVLTSKIHSCQTLFHHHNLILRQRIYLTESDLVVVERERF
jgi:hypothetical protein